MGILSSRTAFALLAAGCYSPDVRDCALPCATSADCVEDQVCTANNTCASPMVACGVGDAMPAPGETVAVTVTIIGNGTVMIGAITCASTSCTVQLALGVPAAAMAIAKGDEMFTSWTSFVCADQAMNCAFTPTGPTELAVLFSKKN